jgi:phosphoribosylanthranilate isomerase
MRTRIKICGITRPEDGLAAVRLGVDAIGLVFYPGSSRAVTVPQAAEIVRELPPLVTVVGLFVNAQRQEIAETLETTRIDLLQFHGDESPEDCAGHGRPYIKAVRMRDGVDLQQEQERFSGASAILLDSYKKSEYGGTGSTFDWGVIPAAMAPSIILAGGLTPDNVGQAIRQVRPFAVDVSGGVELEKGIKDSAKIEAFVRGVESGDREE